MLLVSILLKCLANTRVFLQLFCPLLFRSFFFFVPPFRHPFSFSIDFRFPFAFFFPFNTFFPFSLHMLRADCILVCCILQVLLTQAATCLCSILSLLCAILAHIDSLLALCLHTCVLGVQVMGSASSSSASSSGSSLGVAAQASALALAVGAGIGAGCTYLYLSRTATHAASNESSSSGSRAVETARSAAHQQRPAATTRAGEMDPGLDDGNEEDDSSSEQEKENDTESSKPRSRRRAPRRLRKAETVLQRRTARLILVIERATDPHNQLAVLRTAEALGVQHVHIIRPPMHKHKSVEAKETLQGVSCVCCVLERVCLIRMLLCGVALNSKVSRTANQWLTVTYWDSTTECIAYLKANQIGELHV
jgi:hypothetical protein